MNIVFIVVIIIIIITFPQNGSSFAGVQVISVSDIGQATITGETPLLFLKSAVCFLSPSYWVSRGWRLGQWLNVSTHTHPRTESSSDRR